ncbi:dihydrofolate reductase family protein [Chitinophaga oryzae]|uniref:Dihydrofolate reductase family protein n=1 Tax=Chitinophaga oryzae TaxID=2725414 RepID=A0AAE7DB08_9BACT|nr:dihydrofolate reductase family protein [Chitinophaga oryzae]QJB34879.1 dihydrofolate reductase family protein [Chitinophaga oryzae]QJB41390.1 dihydrofolate reductase family protein [Chitinophaga oryzae]
MRTVSFGMNISLDGYCDHTTFSPNEELHDYFTDMMQDVDLLFFGRIMYQLMFPYWADVARDQSGTADENRFAERFTAIEKVVVSRTLENAQYNTRIVRGNPAAELMKLKQQPGGTISVDTVSMLPELISAGLIDKFYLVVHPVIVGRGRPLLDAGSLQENFNLKLVDTIVFKSGCVALHYDKQ